MGSHNIDFELDGKASFEEVKAEFKVLQSADASRNGHQDGYSGDFQTVRGVSYHGQTFNSRKEAYDYCLNNAKKWEYLIAVKYKVTNKLQPTKTMVKLEAKVKQYQVALDNARIDAASAISALISISDFIKCGRCKSRMRSVNVRRVTSGQCPVCLEHMYSKSTMAKIDRLYKRLQDAQVKYAVLVKKERDKAAAKSNKVNWLVAGWAAC